MLSRLSSRVGPPSWWATMWWTAAACRADRAAGEAAGAVAGLDEVPQRAAGVAGLAEVDDHAGRVGDDPGEVGVAAQPPRRLGADRLLAVQRGGADAVRVGVVADDDVGERPGPSTAFRRRGRPPGHLHQRVGPPLRRRTIDPGRRLATRGTCRALVGLPELVVDVVEDGGELGAALGVEDRVEVVHAVEGGRQVRPPGFPLVGQFMVVAGADLPVAHHPGDAAHVQLAARIDEQLLVTRHRRCRLRRPGRGERAHLRVARCRPPRRISRRSATESSRVGDP